MYKRISIQNMNDNELRAYKRAYRRKRALQKKCCFISAIVLLIIFISISVCSISSAHDDTETPLFKYYKQIEVQKDDTLWEIARANMNSEKYRHISDYIDEVKSINHLEEDTIVQGVNIIVPYYSNLYY